MNSRSTGPSLAIEEADLVLVTDPSVSMSTGNSITRNTYPKLMLVRNLSEVRW